MNLKRATSYEEICAAMKAASEAPGIGETLGYTDEKVVATDFRGNINLRSLTQKPVSHWIAPSLSWWPGMTMSMVIPATCCVSQST